MEAASERFGSPTAATGFDPQQFRFQRLEPNRQTMIPLLFFRMDKKQAEVRPQQDLQLEALAALEQARAMPHGPARSEALKRAGILQNAADMQGLLFAKRGRPPKT